MRSEKFSVLAGLLQLASVWHLPGASQHHLRACSCAPTTLPCTAEAALSAGLPQCGPLGAAAQLTQAEDQAGLGQERTLPLAAGFSAFSASVFSFLSALALAMAPSGSPDFFSARHAR